MKEPPLAFVAGATGFTGRAIAHQDAAALGVRLRLHARPGSAARRGLAADPRLVECPFEDHEALCRALEDVDCIIQGVGTVRARFDAQTSYESVDYGTTAALLEAARATGVRHFLLISSIGAQSGLGAYLHWKQRTEALVQAGQVPWTVVRPSYLAGDETFPERHSFAALSAFLRGFSDTFLMGGWAADLRPIPIQILARVLMSLVRRGPQRRALSGRELWRIAREEQLYPFVR